MAEQPTTTEHVPTCAGSAPDGTAQARQMKDLQRSEAKWRSVIGNSPVFVAIVDRADRIQFLNRAAPGMTVEEAIGRSVYAFLQPESVATARAAIESVRRTGQASFYESVGAGPNGTLAAYESHVGPVHDGDDPDAVSLISMDVTERKHAEAARRESERKLATLLANLPGMAYRCRNDVRWSMEFVSEGCGPLTGYQPTDLIDNRTVAYGDLIHPEDRQNVWDQVQLAVAERRPFQREYRIRTAQGEERWVWEHGVGVYADDGSFQALEGFISDVTSRKRAEHALRESEQRLARLLANLPGAVYRCKADADWTVEFLSDGYTALTGFPAAELRGQPGTRHNELIHPDDRHAEFEAMQRAVAERRQY